MKNKHIELVKKWLDDKDSVSTEELDESSDAAWEEVATKGVAHGEYMVLAATAAHAAAEAYDVAAAASEEGLTEVAAGFLATAVASTKVTEQWVAKYEEAN